jgi:hypothetical protein
MKNLFTFLILCFVCISGYAQFEVKTGAVVYAENNAIIYTNENFVNDGTVTLNQDSEFVVDKNFTNEQTFNYVNGANKGILVIGSGDATRSNGTQTLEFHPTLTEEPPFIVLNKAGGTATITRGLVELQETFVATSGTFDADSEISDTPDVNTVKGLVFISNGTDTAIIDESSNGAVNNVIVERFIPMSNRAFRAFASSLNTNGSIKENLMEGGQILTHGNVVNPRPGFGTHITGSATVANGFDITNTNFPSMFKYTNPNDSANGYTSIPNTSGTMSAGESYLLMIRGDRSLDLSVSNDQVGTDPTRLRMLGDAQIGDFTFTDALGFQAMPTLSGEFASIGNPYQAQVNLEEVLSSTSTTGVDKTQVYVYDPSFGTENGAWVTVNFAEDTPGNFIFDSAVPDNGPGADYRFLQPNQAFYIESNSTTAPEVRFQESFKRDSGVNGTVDIFSDTSVNTDFSLRMDLYETDENDLRSGLLIRLSDNYNKNFIQEEDAISFFNFLETISTVSEDGSLLAFDKRSFDVAGEVIQIHTQNFTGSNYEFKINVQNNTNQEDIYLIDNYLNTSYLIDSEIYTHSFSVDSGISASVDVNRFQLGINNSVLSNDSFELNGLTVYPNPVVNTVNVNLAEFNGVVHSVQLYDMMGRAVQSKQISDGLNTVDLDMSSLSSGIYIIKLDTDKGQFQKKLIKQ